MTTKCHRMLMAICMLKYFLYTLFGPNAFAASKTTAVETPKVLTV